MTKVQVIHFADEKWNECAFNIISTSFVTGVASALPTPTIEIPKQIAISVGDLTLCFLIYRTYFSDDIKNSKQLMKLLEHAGLVTVVGGTLTYIGYKAARGVFDEIANFVPPIGQILSGLLTVTETVAIGFIWLQFVHNYYINEKS